MTRLLTALAAAASMAAVSQIAVQSDPAVKVDAIFSRWTTATPGCAVGVSTGGRTVLERAYGMSDLEHGVPNAADAIFEAGSVSKQFTAASVLLLARDGRLSLDDSVRKYLPELPDYGTPLTIRHMLTHTSGLRDWGSIEAIAGWPRTTRAYTHAHVLDIVSRQKTLNFTPGTEWSYSNTGYNLAAIIVARVSGKPFAEFTAERIFRPLGMTHTSWRDDFTRVVKHRAIAYAREADGYHQDMPFENVHGNGGLLTTVGDLLRWNENFEHPVVGDAAFVAEEQTPGRFTDGRAHGYGLGLSIGSYRGVREVNHSGSTAGYQAYLVRYPDQRVSVAVLCNAADANATQVAHAVAEVYLGSALTAPAAAGGGRGAAGEPFRPASGDLKAYPGRYVSDEAETEFTITQDGDRLVLKQRPAFVLTMRAVAKDVFAVPRVGTVTFRRGPSGVVDELSVKQDRVWDLRFQRAR
jgi:CubicO group peptidase (beta-lactamase class C family)